MDDDPDNGFDSVGSSMASQSSENFFLTMVNDDDPRSGDDTSHSVSNEHGNDKKLKSNENSIQSNEPNDVPVHDKGISGAFAFPGKSEPGKHKQHAMHIYNDSVEKAAYDKMDAVKKYSESSDNISLAHRPDYIDDDDITTDSKLKFSLIDSWTKKFIAEFKLEKYGEDLLKQMCPLIKRDFYDVFSHQAPTSAIVMPISTSNKTCTATSGNNSNGTKVVVHHQEPPDQAAQLSLETEVISEHPTIECSEGNDHFIGDDTDDYPLPSSGSSGDGSGNHLFASSDQLSHSDTNMCQNPSNGPAHYNSNANYQGEMFMCGAVGESDPVIPLSQDETRTERHQRVEDRIGHRRVDSTRIPIVLQPSSRKQDDPLLYLTNQQYQLAIKVKGKRLFVTIKQKDTDTSQHTHRLTLVDHITYWKHQLTSWGVHFETQTSNSTPVIVAHSNVPALVDWLTAQGFEMTGQADMDPVTLLHLQQQESLISMVFLTDEDSTLPAILSQTDPGYYDYPKNCTFKQFISERGISDDHVPPFHKKAKVESNDAAVSPMKLLVSSSLPPELACPIEDSEMFTVNGAVQIHCDKPIQENNIHQFPQPCSEPLQQCHMQQVSGITCQPPACVMKETGLTVTGALPILPQISSIDKRLSGCLHVKSYDTFTPAPDSKKDTLENVPQLFHSDKSICFRPTSYYDSKNFM